MKFKDLSDDDKIDFRKRLGVFGVDEREIHDGELIVPRDSTLSLPRRGEDAPKPRVLETKNLDDVRRWIGIPEPVARKRFDVPGRPGPLRPSFERVREDNRTLRELTAEQFEELRTAARTYVRGDHQLVKDFKPLLEDFYEVFQVPAWFFTQITVEIGGTLQLGKGVHVLSAWKIKLGKDAKIVSRGSLTVDCTILERR